MKLQTWFVRMIPLVLGLGEPVIAGCGREGAVAAAAEASPPSTVPSASVDPAPSSPPAPTREPIPPRAPLARARGIAIPETIGDIELLAAEGIRTRAPRLVANITEFAGALGPSRTVVLAPGDYVLSELPPTAKTEHIERQYISGASDLTLIGLGDPAPRILASEDDVVASFWDVDRLQIYNLTFGHTAGQGCTTGVLRIQHSVDVSLAGVDLFGSGAHGLTLGHVDGAVISDARIHDCTHSLDVLAYSKDLRYLRVRFDGNVDIDDGFRLLGAELFLDDVTIENNRVGADASDVPLFAMDATDPIAGIAQPDGGEAQARVEPSTVHMSDSKVIGNRFARFTDAPARVSIERTAIRAGQFDHLAHAGTPEWWCACSRRRDSPTFAAQTACVKTQKACEKLEARVSEGADGALAGALVRRCKQIFADKPGSELGGDAWTREGKKGAWRHAGCFFDPRAPIAGATVAGGVAAAPIRSPQAPAIVWETLRPIRLATAGKDGVAIDVAVAKYKAFAKLTDELERAKLDRLPAGDPRLPAEIVSIGTPNLVSSTGTSTVAAMRSLGWIDTPSGSWWVAEFPAVPATGAMVAVSAMPHVDARIRAANEAAEIAVGEAVARSFVQGLESRVIDQVFVVGDATGSYTGQRMAGVFPGGAVEVIAFAVRGADPLEDAYGGVFTADAQGRLVQVLDELSWGTHQLDFVVDLDGDGLDEVGHSSFGIEDEIRVLTRVTAEKLERILLFDAGH